MTILRTDKIAGLESVNAITGSVFFDGASIIVVDDSDDFHYGTGDFTVEGWIYATGRNQQMMLIGQWDGNAGSSGTVSWALQLTNDTNGYLRFLISTNTSSVAFDQNASSGGVFDNSWHHFAVTRNGNDYKFFIDGTVVKSFTDSAAIGNATVPLTIGGSSRAYTGGTVPTQMFTGYLSNIRICKGKALYTAAFTPPTRQLEVTSETVLLCCQSSGDMFKEEIGKTLSMDLYTDISGSSPSTFVPDVGNDHTHGTVLEGNVEFPSLNYMTLPRGTTTQSNRGRGVYMVGYANPNQVDDIDYLNIQSMGNTIVFGNLTTGKYSMGSGASSTRGIFCGGYQGGASPDTDINAIEYITIATTGNATDFGDRTVVGRSIAAASSSTRVVMAAGQVGNPGIINTIDYITTATLGNASDFGDLLGLTNDMCNACNSPTRGIFSGGNTPASPYTQDVMQYVTLATTGDATDFGNLTAAARGSYGGTASSNTRGLICLANQNPNNNRNEINYVTIATTGNATDFGDLFTGRYGMGSCSNSLRAVFLAGRTPTYINTIDTVMIATTGNATDFGDVTGASGGGAFGSACSDSHGGLTE